MNWFRAALAAALAGLTAHGTAGAPSRVLVVGTVNFMESSWVQGRTPTINFTIGAGRGSTEKVRAILLSSEEPEPALDMSAFAQVVGDFFPPASVDVALALPDRLPINPHTRERFVQGVLIDPVTHDLLAVTNVEYLDIVYDAEPETFTLDWEMEDDFATPLVDGQDLSTPPELGVLVSISALQPSSGAQHFGPAVFDSSPAGPNAGSSDPDLLVDRGNVLILQEEGAQSVAGIFDSPDDAANGGTIVLDFTGFEVIEKVEPVSIDLVDIDGGSPGPTTVVLTDVLGHSRTYTVPAGWTRDITQHGGGPGVATLDLTNLAPQPGFDATATASQSSDYVPGEVVRMEIALGGSGAVDVLVFRREADPDAFQVGRNRPRIR